MPIKVNFKTGNVLKVTGDRLIMMKGKINLENVAIINK
jgi:hypothetical protein